MFFVGYLCGALVTGVIILVLTVLYMEHSFNKEQFNDDNKD